MSRPHISESSIAFLMRPRFRLDEVTFLFAMSVINLGCKFAIFILNRMKLYKGDCLIESDKIESGSVDLILTDLPYGNMNFN